MHRCILRYFEWLKHKYNLERRIVRPGESVLKQVFTGPTEEEDIIFHCMVENINIIAYSHIVGVFTVADVITQTLYVSELLVLLWVSCKQNKRDVHLKTYAPRPCTCALCHTLTQQNVLKGLFVFGIHGGAVPGQETAFKVQALHKGAWKTKRTSARNRPREMRLRFLWRVS